MVDSIRVRSVGLEDIRAVFGDKFVNDVVRGTINKLAQQSRTQLSKDVRAVYAVKASAVNRVLTLDRAKKSRPEAFVFASGQRIPLRDFGAKKTARGVSVRVRKDRPRAKLTGRPGLGFFISGKIGGHVFRRAGPRRPVRKGRYAGTGIERQRITKIVGPGIPNMIRSDEIVNRLNRFARENTIRLLDQEVNFRIERIAQRNRGRR